jgi:cyclic-di-GMP phosphodiesterase TipF (flagellum assembly factor)
MGRLSAIFVAFCMVLIAASAGIVTYLSFAFTGMEATVTAVAVLTALVMVNSLTSRRRDRFDVGSQIADLSRGTADIGRQVSELDRRIVALEGEIAAAMDRTRSATEPLAGEIDELGQLVKELADAVAAHEQMLESAIAHATPTRMAPPAPMPAPALAPEPTFERADIGADLVEPEPSARPETGPFKGLEPAAIVAQIARAIEANRVDLYLQPIVTLPQRKVRYYEALTRLRHDDGTLLGPEDYASYAESGGLTAAIDNLMVFRSVQVVRRLSTKNREVGLFCNISGATLVNAAVFHEITQFLEANRALAPYLVFQFTQGALRAMGPIEQECLAGLADIGFRFSLDRMTDLRIEPRELGERGFRFVKVPAKLLLSRAAAPQGDIHPADFSDLLGRFGIDLIADRIESEGMVVDLLDYDVRFGQGFLFSPPRPVRAEVLQGIAERSPERAAPPVRTAERPAPTADASPPPEPKPAGPRNATAIAQLARGIMRRAQG